MAEAAAGGRRRRAPLAGGRRPPNSETGHVDSPGRCPRAQIGLKLGVHTGMATRSVYRIVNAHRPAAPAENKRGRRTTRSVATSMRMPRETKLKKYKVRAGGGATRPKAHPAETSSPGVPPSRVRYSAAQARLIRNCPQWTRAPSTISPSPTRLDSNDSRSALKLRWCAAPPKSAQRHSFGGAHCTSPFGCLSATPHLGVERREIGGFGRG